MNEKKVQKQTFLQGTAVLAMATILVKLMGFLFKTPLNNIIGSTGFGYFNTAYDVYNVLLMISTTGLPVAMSRMISEAQALGNEAQIKRIFKTAIYVFIALGIAGSLLPPALGDGHEQRKFLGGHRGAGAVRAADLPDLGLPGLLPGPEQHDPHLRQPDL